MSIDRRRYPRAAAYVAKLPQGLDSHAQCRVKAEVHERVHSEFPELAEEPDLPESIRAFLLERDPGALVSEAVCNATLLMIRDRWLEDDERWMRWRYEVNRSLFNKPLHRVLMLVLSPSLVIMGAMRRWSIFHQGTSLEVTPVVNRGERRVVCGRLLFPAGLFADPLVLRSIESSYHAALDCTSAKETRVSVAGQDQGEARFEASWLA